jgi:glycosyltransferase involved in cell wall biosynthesis
VLSQTCLPREIILVNDASTDNTLAIIEKIQLENKCLVKIVNLPINKGAANARNCGIESASFNLIAFLDSDDIWHSRKIEIQSKVMFSDTSIDLCGHHMELFNYSKTQNISINDINISNISLQKLLFKNIFNTPSVMMRNSGLFFPVDQRYAEDYKLWLDFAILNRKIVFIDTTLAYVLKPFYGSSGLSKSLFKMYYWEFINLLDVFKSGSINKVIVAFAILFSFLKFSRRVFIVYLINIF